MPIRKLTRRRMLKMLACSSGLGAGLGLYTWGREPHWVELVEGALPISNLPSSLVGKRMVQLSDLHIGPRVDDDYLIRSFNRVKSLSPDIVIYTGDFTSYAEDVFTHTEAVFAHLPIGRLATLGILGNHDYGPNWAYPEVATRISTLASHVGVRILRNELTEVNGLQIVGLDDLWAGRFDPGKGFENFNPQQSALVLSHNPDTADLSGWERFQGWILAGHTHGGQCKPPFLPPPLLPVKNRRYVAGVYPLKDHRQMYINRGLGHLLKVRFNSRPEITLFHLQQAS